MKPAIYGQLADDLVIDELLHHPPIGFYIDIGANDPEHLSNTKRFYDRGWRGINIEPNPDLHEKLKWLRVRDTNLNIGIGASGKPMPFYVRDPHQSSSFVKWTNLLHLIRNRDTKLVRTIQIPVLPLRSVSVPTSIDFISIDAEGDEMDVLASNDWNRIRPRLVVVEFNQSEKAITEYLALQGYGLVYQNPINGFFLEREK